MVQIILCLPSTDKRWLARCSNSFVSDIADRRTRERSFRYFQLNISISTPHLHIKTWTDLLIHSIKQRNLLSHSLERYCEILTRKKIDQISSANNFGHLGYKEKVQDYTQTTAIDEDVCTDFTLYSEGWGYFFAHNVFTHNVEML